MSKAGKLVKDLVKAKKESVMGKLANGDDPMEPWSKRFDAPIKEEDLNEDTWLYRYVRSLGWDPQHMTFAQQSKYSRSNAFKTWKKSHMERGSAMEEAENLDEAGTGLLMSYIKSKGLDPRLMDGNQKSAYSKSSEFRIFKNRHVKEVSGMGERGDDWNEEKKAVKEAVDAKDTVTMDIPLLIRVLEYAREDAKTDMDLHKVVENLINMRGKGSLSMDMYDKIVAIKEEIEKLGEASYINGVKQDPESKVWKLTSLSHADAVAKHGKENVRHVDAVNRSGDKTGRKHVEVLSKLGEETEQIGELRTSTLLRYQTKANKALIGGDRNKEEKRIKGIQTANYKIQNRYKVKEEVEQVDEMKKQNDNMEIDDRITREDLRQWFSKSHPEGDWKRINSKGEVAGPCAREPGEPKPKCMSKEKRAQLSKSERAAAVAAKRKHDPVADRAGKGGKPVNVSNYGKGKLGEASSPAQQAAIAIAMKKAGKKPKNEEVVDEACWDTHKQVGTKMKGGKVVPNCVPKNEEVEQIDEKNKPTNPGLWSRAKAMARSKFDVYPSAYANGWASKWYKSKGGGWKSVKEDTVQEGIYGIQDSPLSATNSVKAMESTGRKKQMTKSARMIKSIYKKKNVKETMYDWEKSEKGGKVVDEPTAKVIMKGGTTMTGKPRDTIEIEPVLRTKLNRPAGTNPSA